MEQDYHSFLGGGGLIRPPPCGFQVDPDVVGIRVNHDPIGMHAILVNFILSIPRYL